MNLTGKIELIGIYGDGGFKHCHRQSAAKLKMAAVKPSAVVKPSSALSLTPTSTFGTTRSLELASSTARVTHSRESISRNS